MTTVYDTIYKTKSSIREKQCYTEHFGVNWQNWNLKYTLDKSIVHIFITIVHMTYP